MCDPITLILGAVSAAAGAMSLGGGQEAATPPPAAQPAISAPIDTPETEVVLGTPDEVDTSTKSSTSDVFKRRRASANTFGNLGKSALTI